MSQENKCPFCGSNLEQSAMFCSNCGNKLNQTSEVNREAPRPQTPQPAAQTKNLLSIFSGNTKLIALFAALAVVITGSAIVYSVINNRPATGKDTPVTAAFEGKTEKTNAGTTSGESTTAPAAADLGAWVLEKTYETVVAVDPKYEKIGKITFNKDQNTVTMAAKMPYSSGAYKWVFSYDEPLERIQIGELTEGQYYIRNIKLAGFDQSIDNRESTSAGISINARLGGLTLGGGGLSPGFSNGKLNNYTDISKATEDVHLKPPVAGSTEKFIIEISVSNSCGYLIENGSESGLTEYSGVCMMTKTYVYKYEAPEQELALAYPLGFSPKIFTTGWTLGAKSVINGKDYSDQIKWSGSGTFKPGTGSVTKPVFTSPGVQTVTLTLNAEGKNYTKTYTVDTVAPDLYARLGSISLCPADFHSFACQGCPHPSVRGPVISGCDEVKIKGLPVARVGDKGTHAACCGPNSYTIIEGDPDVLIHGIPVAKVGCKTQHCGGFGKIVRVQ